MENRNLILGILAGAAAGVAAGATLGFIVGRHQRAEEDETTPKKVLNVVADVALAKGIEALSELRTKYTHSQHQPV